MQNNNGSDAHVDAVSQEDATPKSLSSLVREQFATANNNVAGGVQKDDETTTSSVIVVPEKNTGSTSAADVGAVNDTPPTYAPSKELSVEDVYNPHNLTMDELEMFLYEWEEEAVSFVDEYFDMKTMQKLRLGENDDDWKEEEDKASDETGSESSSWMQRLKSKMAPLDDGSKTKVEFKGGPTKYLNLSDDIAHVVEFYAPWYGT